MKRIAAFFILVLIGLYFATPTRAAEYIDQYESYMVFMYEGEGYSKKTEMHCLTEGVPLGGEIRCWHDGGIESRCQATLKFPGDYTVEYDIIRCHVLKKEPT